MSGCLQFRAIPEHGASNIWVSAIPCDPPKQASSVENARFRSRAFVGRALNRHPDAARWLRE